MSRIRPLKENLSRLLEFLEGGVRFRSVFYVFAADGRCIDFALQQFDEFPEPFNRDIRPGRAKGVANITCRRLASSPSVVSRNRLFVVDQSVVEVLDVRALGRTRPDHAGDGDRRLRVPRARHPDVHRPGRLHHPVAVVDLDNLRLPGRAGACRFAHEFHLGSIALLRLERAISELGVAVRAEEQQVLEVVVGRVPVKVVDLELSDVFVPAKGALRTDLLLQTGPDPLCWSLPFVHSSGGW